MGNNIISIQDIVNEKGTDASRKIDLLRSKTVDKKVLTYVQKILENLYIEILDDYKGFFFELMQEERFRKWCWETTESAIVFFNDDAYIERGYIKLADEKLSWCYHSWICFKFNDEEYVFDPCLNILCKKGDYVEVYETNIKGKVSAKKVREELIKQITAPKKEDDSLSDRAKIFINKIMGEDYNVDLEMTKVHSAKDVNAPLYRNWASYKTEIDNGNIKKLIVHYYYMDC